MDSGAVKQAVMKQVLTEANLANARVLIEVSIFQAQVSPFARSADANLGVLLETPGKLLRQVRPQARHLPLERRAAVHDFLHGKVHGCLEPGQLCLHHPHTSGAGQPVEGID